MNNREISKYQISMNLILSWFKNGEINSSDFKHLEDEIAKKYCIKDDSIYRHYYLNYIQVRVINIGKNKEQKIDERNGNRTVEKIV